MQHFSRNGKPKCEYYSEEDAIDAMRRMKAIWGVETRPYKCKKCGLWHIGRVENMKEETKPYTRNFKVKNVYQGTATLYRKDGTTWNSDYRGAIEMGERIQSRIEKGFEYEAIVEYSTRGAYRIVDFMELSKNDEMSLEEQRKWAEIEEGDY